MLQQSTKITARTNSVEFAHAELASPLHVPALSLDVPGKTHSLRLSCFGFNYMCASGNYDSPDRPTADRR